jgi:hypothetical protein
MGMMHREADSPVKKVLALISHNKQPPVREE